MVLLEPFLLVVAACVLLLSVSFGILLHELAHAFVLQLLGIPYEIAWLPGRGEWTRLYGVFSGTWAVVTPISVSRNTPSWGLRVAAIAPLLLALPLMLIVAGLVQDPLSTGNVFTTVGILGFSACAIPSPQDFSVFWYADRALEGQ